MDVPIDDTNEERQPYDAWYSIPDVANASDRRMVLHFVEMDEAIQWSSIAVQDDCVR